MAFETLSERLQSALKSVTRKGKLTEKDVDVMMREVRLALLEADVNIKVVREFIKEVKEKAIGETVLKSCVYDGRITRGRKNNSYREIINLLT